MGMLLGFTKPRIVAAQPEVRASEFDHEAKAQGSDAICPKMAISQAIDVLHCQSVCCESSVHGRVCHNVM